MRKIVKDVLKINAMYMAIRTVEEQLSWLTTTKNPLYKNREEPWKYYGENVLIVEDIDQMNLNNFTDSFIVKKVKETLEDYNEYGHSKNKSDSDRPEERKEWKSQVTKMRNFLNKYRHLGSVRKKPKGIMFADEILSYKEALNVTPRTWTQVQKLLKDVRKSKSK